MTERPERNAEDGWKPGGPMPGPLRDDEGRLLHADGTPFTDDEVAEMEHRELAG
jgi:hypothetical protein